MISFAAGNPAAASFPVEKIRAISEQILLTDPTGALQYLSLIHIYRAVVDAAADASPDAHADRRTHTGCNSQAYVRKDRTTGSHRFACAESFFRHWNDPHRCLCYPDVYKRQSKIRINSILVYNS